MKETSRNVAVGLTVLVALGLLAAMILIFAGLPQAFQGGYVITMLSQATYDVHDGDSVYLSGIRVGRITDIRFTHPNDPGGGVTFVARIEADINVPANAKAIVFTKGFTGSAYLELQAEGLLPVDPQTGKPVKYLPTDDSAVVSVVRREGGLIPDELREGLDKLSRLADTLNRMLAAEEGSVPTSPMEMPTRPATMPGGFRGALARLNRTLDALHAVLGDVENQSNLKTSLANLARATSSAADTMESLQAFAAEGRRAAAAAGETLQDVRQTSTTARQRVDELAVKLIEDAEKISAFLTTLNQAAAKIDSGEGTAGKLLNDPKLYNDLVEATRQMAELLKEFRTLLDGWKQSGVPLKLK